MTDEQRKQRILALLEERRGCVANNRPDRVKLIDVQLRELGAEGAPPLKRATRRKRATVG